ncbi:antibiotic biosynthesis monooxygenase [Fulvivirga sp. 29W222]|uniref:Antibiotic biosynthesis monooxygenase n=1 Tax=Fulvivirga marina TaxID=2494733 RepID=A0A937G1C3_9BACT|nr:antibiotic biosynthesis monooxygenase family protein [Fulvivirga marina]MBL6448371.1 antibiotic biosynthesis monooxygenase [Fulvivirga marina]
MLIRIVRMTFREEEVENFLKIFNASKHKIRSFSGCNHLELHKDYNKDNIYVTYSHWDNENALNNYRHSDLFKSVWTDTKALFADKPVAYSHREVMVV